MNPARVLFVLGTLAGGGSERRMIDLLERLDRTRFAPELSLAYRTGELLPEVPADVPVHAFTEGAVPQTLGQRIAGRCRLLSEARMFAHWHRLRQQRYDLIFAWGLRRAYETALPARWCGVPRAVYCVQDPAAEVTVDFPFRSPWRKTVARWSYRTAKAVLANSRDLCQRVEAFYNLPAASVQWMPNLKDFTKLEQLSQTGTPTWTGTAKRIITIGRLQEQKGHACLLEAFARLVHEGQRDLQLVVCGQGPLEGALRNQIQQLRLTDRVQLTGYRANPYPELRTADLFVLPSLWEGLPNTLLEAVALGMPVVAADCPTGPREILEDGRLGKLVPPGDPIALADAIADVFDHPEEARAKAALAQPVIRAQYDLNTGIRRVEDQLLSLIHGGDRTATAAE